MPEHHRSTESHDAVKLTTGMISVLAALVLGLLTASVKNAFDATDSQIRQFASTLILLNETLKDYGPETAHARELLRRVYGARLEDNWPQESSSAARLPVRMEDAKSGALLDGVRLAVLNLPGGDRQHDGLRSDAASLVQSALQTRWLLIERAGTSIQPLLVEILVVWIALIFLSFGYNAAQRHGDGSSLPRGRGARGLHFSDRRDGRAVRGSDHGFQRADAQRARAYGPIGRLGGSAILPISNPDSRYASRGRRWQAWRRRVACRSACTEKVEPRQGRCVLRGAQRRAECCDFPVPVGQCAPQAWNFAPQRHGGAERAVGCANSIGCFGRVLEKGGQPRRHLPARDQHTEPVTMKELK